MHYWRNQSIIGLRQAGEPEVPRGFGDVCEILCCFFWWCKSVAGRADVHAERGHTTAELDIALHLFTNWYLTEADLMSFR